MPPVINQSIIAIDVVFIIIYIIYLFKIKAFKMNAEPLTHQPLFKAALIIPIVSFLLLGSIVWINRDIRIDAVGFDNFLTISKLPLAILSLSIPLGVIVNNVHRTIQTDKQIKEAEKKNTIDGFYSHRKNNIEILQNIQLDPIYILGEKHQIEIRNAYFCYKAFFPFATQSNINFTPSQFFITRTESLWLKLTNMLHKPEWNGASHYYQYVNNLEKCLHELHSTFNLKELDNRKVYSQKFLDEDGIAHEFRTLFHNENDFKWTISAYWQANLLFMEFLEHKFTDEFKDNTRSMFDYVLSNESRFPTWGSDQQIYATVPQIVRL